MQNTNSIHQYLKNRDMAQKIKDIEQLVLENQKRINQIEKVLKGEKK